jgi:zinc transport system substrate-binding protein
MNLRGLITTLSSCIALASFGAGCGSNANNAENAASESAPTTTDSASRLRVVTAFYPLAEAARRVGGDAVEVTDLTPVGGGPHDIELLAKDLETLEGADLVIYLGGGFQPAVQKAVDQLPTKIIRK